MLLRSCSHPSDQQSQIEIGQLILVQALLGEECVQDIRIGDEGKILREIDGDIFDFAEMGENRHEI